VAIIIEDWDASNQPLVWPFLSDRAIDSFNPFLLAVCEKLSSDVRAAIRDRSQTQITAISQVFSNVSIIFCCALIMRNVKQSFGPKHAVTTALSRFFAGALILQKFETYRIKVSDKQTTFIDNVLISRHS
jgi:hypothetical protein